MLPNIFLYLAGFVGLWVGAGLIIKPISDLAKSFKLSPFNLSFIILGIATSFSELSVGLNSIIANDPEIFVGNIIGGSLVIFLLIIPLLSIMGNRLTIDKELRGANLPMVIGTIVLPSILSFDGQITHTDAGISLVAYIFLVALIQQKQSIFARLFIAKPKKQAVLKSLLKIIFGLLLIFFSAKIVVQQTIFYAHLLNISPFLLSLLLISLGTNLPEIALGVRSLFSRQQNIAFGDYVGSAAFNSFLFGFLSLLSKEPISLTNSYWIPLLTTGVGFSLFYIFAKSKNTLSKRESAALLLVYIGFLTAEVLK